MNEKFVYSQDDTEKLIFLYAEAKVAELKKTGRVNMMFRGWHEETVCAIEESMRKILTIKSPDDIDNLFVSSVDWYWRPTIDLMIFDKKEGY